MPDTATPEQPNCETCKWFVPWVNTSPSDKNRTGDCYRYPPESILVTQPGGEGTVSDFRPTVGSDEYCGEYTPKAQ